MDNFSLFSIQDRLLKQELKQVEIDKMSIAQRIQRIEDATISHRFQPNYINQFLQIYHDITF